MHPSETAEVGGYREDLRRGERNETRGDKETGGNQRRTMRKRVALVLFVSFVSEDQSDLRLVMQRL